MAWRAAMVLIAFLALAADRQCCSGSEDVTFQQNCISGDLQNTPTTTPSNAFQQAMQTNTFKFNTTSKKCVLTSQYKCNPGYGFRKVSAQNWGQKIKFESNDGIEWTVQKECTEITTYCPEPEHVLNGMLVDSDNTGHTLGSTRTFRCKDGYKLKAGSNPVITCTKYKSRTGLWRQLPVCEAEDPVSAASDQTGNLGTDQPGNLGTGLSITSTTGQINIAIATTPPGGDGDGETAMTDEDVMTASPPDTAGETAMPDEDVMTTSPPDGAAETVMPDGGVMTTSPPDAAVETTVPDEDVMATSEETNMPSIGISCPQPDSLTNGKSRHTGVSYQDTVTYECSTGYSMVDPPTGTLTATCMANKQWSQPVPECQRISCPQPDSLTNGKSRHTGVRYQDTVTYECDTGYSMVDHPTGTLTATCMANKAWSQPVPECQPRQQLATRRRAFTYLGVSLAPAKVEGPAHVLTFIGVILDTRAITSVCRWTNVPSFTTSYGPLSTQLQPPNVNSSIFWESSHLLQE
ncbi:sushi, von Willebrand factor type A, EGF and pentraxin domain-containing protein 1-like [Sycon ciliatum]|uniref:sushi, von Willebrand factor type A, EGF and pentraxin domain-containing protein 1-like n=1 Tax=Sycon ciliatum TaxID=27933 RepID=UPI0031F5F089